MAIRDIDYLKTRFSWGDIPTEEDFSDLIDTLSNAGYGILSNQVSGFATQLNEIRNAQYILNLLNNQISVAQLSYDLNTKISNIPALSSLLTDINLLITDPVSGLNTLITNPTTGIINQIAANNLALQSISAQINQLIVSDFNPDNDYNLLNLVRYEGNTYKCISPTTHPSPIPTDTDYWVLANDSNIDALISQEASARIAADLAEAQIRSDLADSLWTATGINASNITNVQNTLVTAINAAASASNSLTSQTINFITDTQRINDSNAESVLELIISANDNRKISRVNTANITKVDKTITTLNSALASSVESLAAQILSQGATAQSAIQNEMYARSEAISGVLSTTAGMLTALQSQTASSLSSAFNTTSTSADDLGTAITKALNAVSASANNNVATALSSYATIANLNSSLASAVQGVNTYTDNAISTALVSYVTRSTLDSATASAIIAAVASAGSNTSSSISSYAVSADNKFTTASQVQGIVSNSTSGFALASTLTSYATKTELNSATASAITSAVASAGANTSSSISSYAVSADNKFTTASQVQGIISSATTGFALSSALTSYATTAALNSAVANMTSTIYTVSPSAGKVLGSAASTATLQQVFNSINGIQGEYTIKIDVGGTAASFGLINSGSSGSAFGVTADTFFIRSASSTARPFTVGTVNGVSTVGINGQLILDGTLTVTGNAIVGGSLTIGGSTFTYSTSGFGPTQRILNSDISISSNGTLSNAGGGQVTISGLGYTGDLNATNGAPSGTYVAGTLAQTVASNAAVGATKNKTFYQTTAPTGVILGDLWYDYSTARLKRYNGSTWDLTADSTSGILSLNSALTVQSQLNITGTGVLMTGAVSGFKNGTGLWSDCISGVPKMSLGIGNGTTMTKGFSWDGTDFNIAGNMQSSNYVTGTSGWKLGIDGSAEFQTVNIIGTNQIQNNAITNIQYDVNDDNTWINCDRSDNGADYKVLNSVDIPTTGKPTQITLSLDYMTIGAVNGTYPIYLYVFRDRTLAEIISNPSSGVAFYFQGPVLYQADNSGGGTIPKTWTITKIDENVTAGSHNYKFVILTVDYAAGFKVYVANPCMIVTEFKK